jgi:drug/metabolite transporter (DMT)-like permease
MGGSVPACANIAPVIAIGLGCLSALFFGAMSVALRVGLDRDHDAELATFVTVLTAFAVVVVFAAAEAPSRGVHAAAAWPFLLAGLLQPGVGQLLVTLAIREAGAARASVVLGAAPLTAVTIALVFLGEPARWPLLAGAVLIVAGGSELARDRRRPAHVRRRGYAYAFVVTILLGVRDNLTRWLSGTTPVPPAVAAAACLAGAAVLIVVVLGPRVRRRLTLARVRPYVAIGVLFACSYVTLFEAYYRGRVTVVSPIVATESLWGVLLSVLLIRHTELVGRRVVIGALLVVAGSGLIGAYAG